MIIVPIDLVGLYNIFFNCPMVNEHDEITKH